MPSTTSAARSIAASTTRLRWPERSMPRRAITAIVSAGGAWPAVRNPADVTRMALPAALARAATNASAIGDRQRFPEHRNSSVGVLAMDRV